MSLRQQLLHGMAIPAHPLALTPARKLDERRQRALTRYYIDAGAGGLAVGVHTTQFAIHETRPGLLAPVLELAHETATTWRRRRVPPVMIAGIIGPRRQALREARLARDLGYDIGLLSLAALPTATIPQLLEHVRAVAEVIPVMGFYLQPAVGGRRLEYDFWRKFVEIENVVAIKIAPFNRYDTMAVMRAVLDSGQERRVALYTGNDDHIILDLLTSHTTPASRLNLRMTGGLLGHWAYWTRNAVQLHARCLEVGREGPAGALLSLAADVTDANGAIFDAANDFRGCIPGIHEILRRQGLLRGRWCLDPAEELSDGQMLEIDRVCRRYPHLTDTDFVEEWREAWLA